MFTRIRPRILRPWIRRPRGIAVFAAAVVILTNSSVYAQRSGGGCGSGMSGGTGAAGQSFAGGAGMPGMMGGGFGNPAAMMQNAQMRQMQQGLFNVGPASAGFDVDDHQAWLKARKAYRAAQAEQRKKRLAGRAEKQTKQVASHSRSSTSQ